MNRFLSVIILVLLSVNVGLAKDKKDEIPDYTITGTGGTNSSKLITVTIFTNKPNNVTIDMLEKAAVHGLLFRGFTHDGQQMGSSYTAPPIMRSPMDEITHSDFFEPFFQRGMYKSYVSHVNGSRRVIKAGKQHKVSCLVEINEGLLMKDLQDAGVRKKGAF